MNKMVKCKVLKGHRFGHIDRSGDTPKRVTAMPGDIVLVSEAAATRYTSSLMPVNKIVKDDDRKVDVEKANKELAGKSAEKIQEEADADAKKADKAANAKGSK